MNGGLNTQQGKFKSLFHVSDWHQTILSAMECNEKQTPDTDGIDQWEALQKKSESKRFSILHNIDPMKRAKGNDVREWIRKIGTDLNFDINSQSALRFGPWKILTGDPAQGVPDGNIPPPERNQTNKIKFKAKKVHQSKLVCKIGIIP